MANINFNSNAKTYAINGDENKTICINTTDYSIIDRIKASQKRIDELSEKYSHARIENTDDISNMFVACDNDIREEINRVFDSDVCTSAFGNTNCLSPCENGNMLYENFLNAILPIIEQDIKKAQSAQQKHIEKYTKQVK